MSQKMNNLISRLW